MKSVSFKIGRKRYSYKCPDKVSEMTSEQTLFYFKFLNSSHEDLASNMFSLIPVMWNIPFRVFDKLYDEHQYLLLKSCMIDDERLKSKWLVKSYNGLTGPADGFGATTWGEWIFVDNYHQRYCETRDVVSLQKLVGVLYRKPGDKASRESTGDEREPFNSNKIEQYRMNIGFLKPEFTMITLMNYSNLLSLLSRRYSNLFNKPAEKEALKSGDKNRSTWLEIGLDSVDNDPIRAEELNKINMHLVLKSMDAKAKTLKQNGS